MHRLLAPSARSRSAPVGLLVCSRSARLRLWSASAVVLVDLGDRLARSGCSAAARTSAARASLSRRVRHALGLRLGHVEHGLALGLLRPRPAAAGQLHLLGLLGHRVGLLRLPRRLLELALGLGRQRARSRTAARRTALHLRRREHRRDRRHHLRQRLVEILHHGGAVGAFIEHDIDVELADRVDDLRHAVIGPSCMALICTNCCSPSSSVSRIQRSFGPVFLDGEEHVLVDAHASSRGSRSCRGPARRSPACCISAMARPDRLAMPWSPSSAGLGPKFSISPLASSRNLSCPAMSCCFLRVVELGLVALVAHDDAIGPHRLASGLLDVVEGPFLGDDPAGVQLVQTFARRWLISSCARLEVSRKAIPVEVVIDRRAEYITKRRSSCRADRRSSYLPSISLCAPVNSAQHQPPLCCSRCRPGARS